MNLSDNVEKAGATHQGNLAEGKILGSRERAGLYALGSALLFASGNVAVRFASSYVSVWSIILARCFLGLIVISFVAMAWRVNLTGLNRKAMILTGVINVASVLCVVNALIQVPLFEALVLLYLYPAFAAILSPRLVQDRIGAAAWLLIGLAFSGTVLILWPRDATFSLKWGHFLALAAAFGQALGLTLIRRYSKEHHPLSPFFYFCLIGTLVTVWPALTRETIIFVPAAGWLWLILMALLTAGAQLSLYRALTNISSPEAGIISMTEVVWGGALGFLVFSEPLTWLSLCGSSLILGSGVLLNLFSRQNRAVALDGSP